MNSGRNEELRIQSFSDRSLIFTKMRILQVLAFLALSFLKDISYGLADYETMLLGCKNIESSTPMLRLKRHLFCEYDPSVRPTLDHNVVTNVSMTLIPRLMEFDEFLSTMTLHSWMTFSWNDSHLTWSKSDFDNIVSMHVKSDELWTPDISIYNSGDLSLDQHGIPTTNCLLYNTGTVLCVPSMKHTVKCETDFTYWPYDKHQCRINFGSWSHSGEEVNFHLENEGYRMEFSNNSQWDFKILNVRKVLKKYKCCPNDTYPMIVYEFAISRHFAIVHSTFIIPAITLTMLTLTVLWLDSRSTERIAVASVNFICHLLCIFDLHWQLPHNGANPPNIMLFYRDSLGLAAFALILTTLLRKLQDMSIDVPNWISSTTTFVLSNKAGRFLVLSDEDSKISADGILGNEDESSDLPKSSVRGKESSWRHFAAIVEWLSFFCVIFAYVIILTTLVPLA